MFERQGYQIAFTIVAAVALLWLGRDLQGDSCMWLWLGVIVAVAHQTYVWLIWRLELIYKWVTKSLGKAGFNLYVAGFFVFFFARMLTAIMLAYYDRNTICLPAVLQWGLVAAISIPGVYTFYSVARYFGLKRAAGADHFFEEYRNKPFVKEGMFKYTSNSMYTFGTAVILLPGLIAQSYFALALGLFNYAYVWVHYFCLEKPDIKRIYGGTAE